jgi:hypothetical protein
MNNSHLGAKVRTTEAKKLLEVSCLGRGNCGMAPRCGGNLQSTVEFGLLFRKQQLGTHTHTAKTDQKHVYQ